MFYYNADKISDNREFAKISTRFNSNNKGGLHVLPACWKVHNVHNKQSKISTLNALISPPQFELLERLGFEGYSVLVNTGELATHSLGTSKGKDYLKTRQQVGKPVENPFIGHIFSQDTGVFVCTCVFLLL